MLVQLSVKVCAVRALRLFYSDVKPMDARRSWTVPCNDANGCDVHTFHIHHHSPIVSVAASVRAKRESSTKGCHVQSLTACVCLQGLCAHKVWQVLRQRLRRRPVEKRPCLAVPPTRSRPCERPLFFTTAIVVLPHVLPLQAAPSTAHGTLPPLPTSVRPPPSSLQSLCSPFVCAQLPPFAVYDASVFALLFLALVRL